MDLALEDHPIHRNQHDFQRGLSTETAISKTVNYIEKHINSGREVLGVFLDIQAAFDTICPKHIKASFLKHVVFLFKQKTAYEISACLVGSEMCIRDRCQGILPVLPGLSLGVFQYNSLF